MSRLPGVMNDLVTSFSKIGMGLDLSFSNSRVCVVQAGSTVLACLEDIGRNQNDPWIGKLEKSLDRALSTLESAVALEPELNSTLGSVKSVESSEDPNIDLFANAWTQYSKSTFEHSVELVGSRLRASGFDENFFPGKAVFDGGCGTGRLAVFAARMGAERVVAADIGGPSLDFLRDVIRTEDLRNIEVVEQDITDLSNWKNATFDFVASNGVLHHTPRAEFGLIEHWKKVAPGGLFWVYLYGEGGIYWHIFDSLRAIYQRMTPLEVRETLELIGCREGFTYTFLDNFMAPRVYFSLEQVLNLLGRETEFEWVRARGSSEIDDFEAWKSCAFGEEIYGPDGEIRLVVQKARM